MTQLFITADPFSTQRPKLKRLLWFLAKVGLAVILIVLCLYQLVIPTIIFFLSLSLWWKLATLIGCLLLILIGLGAISSFGRLLASGDKDGGEKYP